MQLSWSLAHSSLQSRRLVLGQAMDTSAALEQKPRVDGYDLSSGVLLGKDRYCPLV